VYIHGAKLLVVAFKSREENLEHYARINKKPLC